MITSGYAKDNGDFDSNGFGVEDEKGGGYDDGYDDDEIGYTDNDEKSAGGRVGTSSPTPTLTILHRPRQWNRHRTFGFRPFDDFDYSTSFGNTEGEAEPHRGGSGASVSNSCNRDRDRDRDVGDGKAPHAATGTPQGGADGDGKSGHDSFDQIIPIIRKWVPVTTDVSEVVIAMAMSMLTDVER